MIGERVRVLAPVAGPVDSMGEPAVSWETHDVDGCLVRPLQGSDPTETVRPDGAAALYSIAFPKTYGGPPLEGARVLLAGRGQTDERMALAVIGAPDATSPCPTAWNMVAEVGRLDG